MSGKELFRLVVCGGRDYQDSVKVERVLEMAHQSAQRHGFELVLIEGGASGVDAFAHRWAHRKGVRQETFAADWKAFGKAAGPLRNRRMLEAGADLVLAFPGGKGTADMVRQARRAGVQVESAEETP